MAVGNLKLPVEYLIKNMTLCPTFILTWSISNLHSRFWGMRLTCAAQMLSRSCIVSAFSLMTKRRIFSSFSTYCGWCRLSRSTMDRMWFCWIHSCRRDEQGREGSQRQEQAVLVGSYDRSFTYGHALGSQPLLLLGVMPVGVVGHAGDHLVDFIKCIHFAIKRGNLQ